MSSLLFRHPKGEQAESREGLRRMECSTIRSTPSHNIKPGRRRLAIRSRTRTTSTLAHIFAVAVLVLFALCSAADARLVARRARDGGEIGIKAQPVDLVVRSGAGARGDRQGPAIHLLERQDPLDVDNPKSTKHSSPTKTKSSASATSEASASSSSSSSAPAPTDTTLPRVFDSSLGANFTEPSCPNFFNKFLNNSDFNGCLPFSLLLQNSQSFFEASMHQSSLNHVLDATCRVVLSHCATIMSGYAEQIRDDANCGADYRLGHPLVVAAYTGFVAYVPMYHAGCIKASAKASSGSSSSSSSSAKDKRASSNEYCFVSSTDANAAPADNYIYSLPLGIDLPGASRPTCSPCLKQTMQSFATSAQNMSQPLSKTYSPAALQINNGCGPNWVDASVKPAAGSGNSNSATGLELNTFAGIGIALAVVMWQAWL